MAVCIIPKLLKMFNENLTFFKKNLEKPAKAGILSEVLILTVIVGFGSVWSERQI
jgi:hypothetical protein